MNVWPSCVDPSDALVRTEARQLEREEYGRYVWDQHIGASCPSKNVVAKVGAGGHPRRSHDDLHLYFGGGFPCAALPVKAINRVA